MLKKIFIAAVIFLVAGQFGICNAAMPRNQMFLGGFTFGSRYSEMIKMYGEPIQVSDHVEDNYTCRYGDSVAIGYNKFSNKIQSITVTANNGWTTPEGLAVGMNISRATELYGAPEYKRIGKIKTAYCYFHGNREFGFIIVFDNKSEKILALSVHGGNTMVSFAESYKNIVARVMN